MDLHRLNWTKNDLIGELPREWNHLVGEYDPNPDAKIVHHTLGGPWFNETKDAEYAHEWFAMRDKMKHCEQLSEAKEA
jgi:hypothetical protein